MVDAEARRRAAELVERFRDGTISNFEFDESWPRCDRRDRGLRAVKTMIWRFYSDLEEHTLTEEGHMLTSDRLDICDRCVLFMRSDLEYAWPEDNFLGIGGLGIAGRIFTLGLSVFIDRALRRREERRLHAMQVIGENATWPFLTSREYALHRSTERS